MPIHPSWKEIHPDRFAANVRTLQTGLPPAVTPIYVVKSDAYGHGLVQTVRVAHQEGARWFAVAHLAEAHLISDAVDPDGILLLGSWAEASASELLERKIIPSVFSVAQAERLSRAAESAGVKLPVHLKMDSGMGRLGLMAREVDGWVEPLLRSGPHLLFSGVYSHFSMVEAHRPEAAARQVELFAHAAGRLETHLGHPLMKHLSSTRALQMKPEWDFDAVRPGILLYGYGCSEAGMRFQTAPWMEWKTRLLQVKRLPGDHPVGYYGTYRTRQPTWIGILELGYSDGLHRALSSRGYVLVQGIRRPVIGRISMNWTAIDLGAETDVGEGDEVVLVGSQKGQALWADEVARWARTIPYEILTAIRSPHDA